MVALAFITDSAEQLGTAYAPSFNAASDELLQHFGRRPVVKAPVGGARTAAQCDALGTPWYISDHWEGKGRAADIDNHRWFRDINELLFLAILLKHGWRNITTDGRPFHEEPWHFACHAIIPTGLDVTPIPAPTPAPIQQGADDMTDAIYYVDPSDTTPYKTLPTPHHAGGLTPAPGSLWYQEQPGARLLPLSANQGWDKTPAVIEFQAFAADNSTTLAKRLLVKNEQIGKLIELRGLTTDA